MTFIEAMDKVMPGFDGEIAKMAQRLLINPRKIDFRTGEKRALLLPCSREKPWSPISCSPRGKGLRVGFEGAQTCRHAETRAVLGRGTPSLGVTTPYTHQPTRPRAYFADPSTPRRRRAGDQGHPGRAGRQAGHHRADRL